MQVPQTWPLADTLRCEVFYFLTYLLTKMAFKTVCVCVFAKEKIVFSAELYTP